jgi:hypothetical protein
MKKFLLDYGIKVRLPIILFVVIVSFAVTYYVSYAERNGIGYAPVQPVKYSHKLHAGDMKIDCQYCHVGVEKSRFASVPAVNICMGCHAIARKDTAEVQKLAWYYNNSFPIPWKRIHKVPDFAYFNHSVHINKGIACESCHGDIKSMEVVGQANSFTMGACLNCHRNPHERLPNAKEINAQTGPDNCSACHR